LSFIRKRKKYDQYGENWQHGEEYENIPGSSSKAGTQGSYTGDKHRVLRVLGDDFLQIFSIYVHQSGRAVSIHGKRIQGDLNAELSNLTDVAETRKQTITVNGKSIRLTIPAGLKGQTIKLQAMVVPALL